MGPTDDLRLLAILIAAVSAVFLAFGVQFQNDTVSDNHATKQPGRGSLSFRQLTSLLVRPRWISGLGFMAVGILLQLTALSLAPLIVVQPIGALALVISSLLNARATHTKLNRGTVIAIALSLFGVGGFVLTASGVANEVVLNDDRLREVLGLLGVILVLFAVSFFTIGKRAKALTFIVGAGVLYGFVATLAKVVIQRIYQEQFEWLTVFCLLALVVAMVLGGWFVQNAYSSGPPELVIAGLTVIDPMVAVGIAIVILGEAQQATVWSGVGFATSGLLAVAGVYLLSKVHPEMHLPRRRKPSKTSIG